MQKRIVYVGFAFPHHKNTHAGYHHIKDYLAYDKYIDAQWECDFWENKKKSFYIKVLHKVLFYLFNVQMPFVAVRVLFYGWIHRNSTFHIIYGENIYCEILRFLPRTCKVVCTLHQPFDYFNNKFWISWLKRIDCIILVGNADFLSFQRITEKSNVFFVPHGIDTDYYVRNNQSKRKNEILMVGNWLRDFSFAKDVFSELLKRDEKLVINVVTNESNFVFFKSFASRLNLYTSISDDELKSLYESCKVLFLPLVMYTANNAILEASSMDCPILVASDHPNYSYLPKEKLEIMPLDLRLVIARFENPFFDVHNSEYIQEKYGWLSISKQVRKILKNV
jgi:hypothetical protein